MILVSVVDTNISLKISVLLHVLPYSEYYQQSLLEKKSCKCPQKLRVTYKLYVGRVYELSWKLLSQRQTLLEIRNQIVKTKKISVKQN